MRFKANISNAVAFHKFAASLASLGPVAWVKLNSENVCFTIIPEQGTQVWAQLAIDTVFDTYTIQSAADKSTINMEVPLPPLLRALKAASNASFASIRLTKKDGIPWLVMTIIHTSFAISSNPGNSGSRPGYGQAQDGFGNDDEFGMHDLPDGVDMGNPAITTSERRERETTITLDIPVHVLAPPQVEGLHEPRCREPDVHIYLPPLQQLKTISERFSRLASSSSSAPGSSSTAFEPRGRTGGVKKGTKLDLAATMHGHLRISLASDSLRISSTWRGLDNPELDAEQVPGGEDALRDHPSTRMRRTMPDEDDDEGEGWAKVRIDANDWRKVLSVGRVGGRVIACFCKDHALILYCYMPTIDDAYGGGGDESVLTYYISSVSR